jgi:hypothetical protein
LVVSLLGAGVSRSLVLRQRHDVDVARNQATTANPDLSKVNSFALGLLLGGLRGPLVMALWTSSENQKTDRNLEDFDTKVELIRLLQPEFDTVHLFQIWNKAYNISVQMANVPNKYTTILDALAYGFSVDKERPDNVNILAAIGGLYFDKFGGAAEKAYFSSRLRTETMAPVDRIRVTFDASKRDQVVREARLAGGSVFQLGTFEADEQGKQLFLNLPKDVGDALKARLNDPSVKFEVRPVSGFSKSDAAGRPTQHEPLLDEKNNLLAGFLKPRDGAAATADAADGSDMPYLAEFQPYPYGVSPYALAYNYYKRCKWLQENRDARHAQLSDRVIASRAPMSLEKWAEEEWYAAVRAEIDLAGRPQPAEEGDLVGTTLDLLLDAGLPNGPLFDQAIFRFNNASRLCERAATEYVTHLKSFPDDELTYRSHILDLGARAQLTAGDALYLQTMRASGGNRKELARQATDRYTRAANLYTRHLFRYYLADEDAAKVLPQDIRGLRRADVDDPSRLRDDELAPALGRMRALYRSANYELSNGIDFKEIDSYVLRCYARQRNLSRVN